MRQKALRLLRARNCGDSLQAEDLVHDTFLRLTGHGIEIRVMDGQHYVAIASRMMRRSLIDRSRAARAFKRFGHLTRTDLTAEIPSDQKCTTESLWVSDLLDKCTSQHSRLSIVARLHFLEEKTVGEIAEHLGISSRTVKRDLRAATLRLRQISR
jgi:RNA polymerase sigma factor (sigma-70 family)